MATLQSYLMLKWQHSLFGDWSCSKHARLERGKPIMSIETTKIREGTSWHPLISDTDMLVASPKPVTESSEAPIVNALKAFAERDVACFHFPGHRRGTAAPPALSELIGPGAFLHDIPNLPELDDLFCPKGVILDAQRRAAELFGSSETCFLVNGTTCGIQASILATCSPGERLILPRNSHVSATSGLVLSGAIPKYIMPEYSSFWDVAGGVTPLQVERAIQELEEQGQRAAAVMVTSPTYQGICSNLGRIAEICHSYGAPLIVDEAHGAHFKFHPRFPSTALEQGADLVAQSTHKVLCSFTQSSMLHVSGNLIDRDRLSKCLQTVQTTSPSYLLLMSLDAARAQLHEEQDHGFDKAMELGIGVRHQIAGILGVSVLDLWSFFSDFPAIDPLRLTLGFSQLGLTGFAADDILREKLDIIPEMVGSQCITYAINLGTQMEDIQRLVSGVKKLSENYFPANGSKYSVGNVTCGPFTDVTMRLTPREAFFAKKRKVNIADSLGEICGELICPFPPGIPVLIPGEVITESALSYLVNIRRIGACINGAADAQLNSIVICSL